MQSIIQVEGVSKRYRLGAEQLPYSTLREVLVKAARAPLRRNGQSTNILWALKDVSFEVQQGEVVGIVGRNGAGKSTLLKVLSRITEPTTGRVVLYGRVGSLLEVGTGFHPELSGRDNVYLNGAILGMKRVEIKRHFDEIVAFAEVEKFIDTPVKHYSSGMYLRLAFAVAAHLNPEILIVDEVLAVGDAQFQKKCIGKMGEISKQGRTVLFVSHNMDAVRKLCDRAILLHQGQVELMGKTEMVLRKYIHTNVETLSTQTIARPADDSVPGYAYQLSVEHVDNSPASAIPVGQAWQIRVHFKINKPVDHFIIALGLITSTGVAVRTSWSEPQTIEPGDYEAVFRENTIWLEPGIYPIVLGLSSFERSFQYVENAGSIEIAGFSEGIDLVRVENSGLILNPSEIQIKRSTLGLRV